MNAPVHLPHLIRAHKLFGPQPPASLLSPPDMCIVLDSGAGYVQTAEVVTEYGEIVVCEIVDERGRGLKVKDIGLPPAQALEIAVAMARQAMVMLAGAQRSQALSQTLETVT